MKTVKTSIVILNYNTKDLTIRCLKSLEKVRSEIYFDIVIIDNGSSDGSSERFKDYIKDETKLEIKLVVSRINLGFAKGNNLARKHVKGKYVLILNSDTLIHQSTLNKAFEYMEKNPQVGMLTCKMVREDGSLDLDARRSFPTPWVAFTHLILRIDRLFPKSKIFSRYWYGYKDPQTTHEIDVAQGAFMFTRKKVLDEVGWFDEDYFLDGEDIDLCWKIKKKGWKIIYYPEISITHIKKASKRNNNLNEESRFTNQGLQAMRIFYTKRLSKKYHPLINYLVYLGISVYSFARRMYRNVCHIK